MSALTYLMQNQDFEAVLENVFVDSCVDLIKRLDETGLASIDEYIGLLEDKKVKKSLEMEISEALIPILENNAALYGTFLFEGDDVELTKEEAKTFLESVRGHFGREFIIEALSEKAKQRLKTGAKIGAGLAAAGAAGVGLYNKFKGNDDDGGDEAAKLAPRNIEALKREGTGSMYKRVANISKAGQDNDAQGSAAKVAASQSDAQAAENASQGKLTSKNFWSRAPKKVASSFTAKGR
jgi:hypothetical protein